MIAKLILVSGKADKSEVTLHLPTLVGRMKGAGLMIAHSTVSRRHCEIFPRDDVLYVRDLGSLNGTVVDGQTLKDAESPLLPGQTLTVGPLTFRAAYETTAKVPSAAAPDSTLANVGETVEMAVGDITVEDISAVAAEPAGVAGLPDDDAEHALDALAFDDGDDLSLDFVAETATEGNDENVAKVASAPIDAADDIDELQFDLVDESSVAGDIEVPAKPSGIAELAQLAMDDLDSGNDLAFDLSDEPSSDAHAANADDANADDERPAKSSGIADLAQLAMEDLDGDDDLTFDLADEPAPGASGKPAAQAAAGDEDEMGFDLKDLELDGGGAGDALNDELMFDLADDSPAQGPAVAALGDDLGEDDELDFKLEDFDEPAPKKNGAEPKSSQKATQPQKAPSSVPSNPSAGGEEDLDKFFDDLGL